MKSKFLLAAPSSPSASSSTTHIPIALRGGVLSVPARSEQEGPPLRGIITRHLSNSMAIFPD